MAKQLNERQIRLLRFYMPGERTLEGKFDRRTFRSLVRRDLLTAVDVGRGDYGIPFAMVRLTSDGMEAVLNADAKALT